MLVLASIYSYSRIYITFTIDIFKDNLFSILVL